VAIAFHTYMEQNTGVGWGLTTSHDRDDFNSLDHARTRQNKTERRGNEQPQAAMALGRMMVTKRNKFRATDRTNRSTHPFIPQAHTAQHETHNTRPITTRSPQHGTN